MKRILIFANCQGRFIIPFLKMVDSFEIDSFHNYKYIYDTKINKNILKKLKTCDIFIYQPLSDKYPVYNTKKLLTYLKNDCQTISFPYIYNDAFTPLIKTTKKDDYSNGEYSLDKSNKGDFVYKNTEPIIKLKNKGYTLDQILNMYKNNEIDFLYSSRFNESISILREKEKYTDIKISQFIIDNHQKHKLFLYHFLDLKPDFTFCNHPSNILINEYSNLIIEKMGYNRVILLDNIINCWEMYVSRYDIAYYNYEWIKDESLLIDDFCLNVIKEIYETK